MPEGVLSSPPPPIREGFEGCKPGGVAGPKIVRKNQEPKLDVTPEATHVLRPLTHLMQS
jgi:hypothetical protein